MEVVLFAHWIVNLPTALKGLGESSVVAPLLAMCRAVSFSPSTTNQNKYPSVVVHVWNLSRGQVKA